MVVKIVVRDDVPIQVGCRPEKSRDNGTFDDGES